MVVMVKTNEKNYYSSNIFVLGGVVVHWKENDNF